MRIEKDPFLATGRTLWLDDLEHSYVDLADPTYLEFDYTKSIDDVVQVAFPEDPIEVLFVGGGGFTLPRAFVAQREGTRATVLELDPAVVDLARDELGLETGRDLRVQIGDGRIGIRDQPSATFDLVVGDAFGSLSVPWHLTTREFVAEVRRVLRPGGVYAMNVIDYPPFRFARAELATLQASFQWVGLIANTAQLDGTFGGNLVLVASDAPLDTAALEERTSRHGNVVVEGAALDEFVDDAPELTDDYAPVDQWLVQDRANAS
jgi:SAM-dependent methyltransferase